MSLLRACSLILLLPSLISPVFAEDAHLVGCKEVSCPKQGADDRCTLEDNTFLGIGISTIPKLPSPLGDLSLMKGVNVSLGLPGEGNDKPTRAFKSNYYLAVPENIKSSELSGCAVMFNDPPKKKFKDREGNDYISNTQAATGTCADVLEETCIEAINAHARNATENGDGNVCDRLKRELKRDSFDSCKGFGGQGSSLGDFTVRSLGDLDAVKNSSDCWPVQQKSDQLMGIAEIISHANYSANALIQEAYKITPVLTVFLGGNDSLIERASSQMTCIKVVTEEDPIDVDDGSQNSATVLNGGWLAIKIAVLVVIATELLIV